MSQLVSAATDRETRGSSDITLQSGCRNLLTVVRRGINWQKSGSALRHRYRYK
jgi:hypothetical protein